MFARWLADGSPQARLALPFWADRGDLVSIDRFRARADSSVRIASGTQRLPLTHDVGAATAYRALAARDTSRALQAFAQLADTLCLTCYIDRL